CLLNAGLPDLPQDLRLGETCDLDHDALPPRWCAARRRTGPWRYGPDPRMVPRPFRGIHHPAGNSSARGPDRHGDTEPVWWSRLDRVCVCCDVRGGRSPPGFILSDRHMPFRLPRCRPPRRRTAVLVTFAAALVLLNLVAYMQARAFTHFVAGGQATGS